MTDLSRFATYALETGARMTASPLQHTAQTRVDASQRSCSRSSRTSTASGTSSP